MLKKGFILFLHSKSLYIYIYILECCEIVRYVSILYPFEVQMSSCTNLKHFIQYNRKCLYGMTTYKIIMLII